LLYIANKSIAKGLQVWINQSKVRVQPKSWIVRKTWKSNNKLLGRSETSEKVKRKIVGYGLLWISFFNIKWYVSNQQWIVSNSHSSNSVFWAQKTLVKLIIFFQFIFYNIFDTLSLLICDCDYTRCTIERDSWETIHSPSPFKFLELALFDGGILSVLTKFVTQILSKLIWLD
jgi:hypothetical protein